MNKRPWAAGERRAAKRGDGQKRGFQRVENLVDSKYRGVGERSTSLPVAQINIVGSRSVTCNRTAGIVAGVLVVLVAVL